MQEGKGVAITGSNLLAHVVLNQPSRKIKKIFFCQYAGTCKVQLGMSANLHTAQLSGEFPGGSERWCAWSSLASLEFPQGLADSHPAWR